VVNAAVEGGVQGTGADLRIETCVLRPGGDVAAAQDHLHPLDGADVDKAGEIKTEGDVAQPDERSVFPEIILGGVVTDTAGGTPKTVVR